MATNRKRLPSQAAIWLLFLLLLVGCEAPQEETTPVPTPTLAPITVGLLLPETQNDFYISIHQGAEEAADRLNARLMVEVADNEIGIQIAQGRTLITRRVSALIIVPVDSDGISPIVSEANGAGIPVVTIDRRAASGEVLTHISSDNVAGGDIAGDYLARAISGRGHVIELAGLPGASSTQERARGFREALREFPEVEIVASEPANYEKQQARALFARLLEEYELIDAVFAHNDDMVLGAIEAATVADRIDEIAFVGFDAVPDAVTAIESGTLRATVAQQPIEMGRLGVELVVDYLREGVVPPAITLVDLALVTR